MDIKKAAELALVSAKVRRTAMQMVFEADSGHLGGSLSVTDILSVLYFDKMNIDPKNPKNPDRDRFVLSKGHCTPAIYPILALRGFFPYDDLKGFRDIDSYLSGHIEMKYVPGVDMSAGSLGQGFSASVGMALAAKIDGKDYHTYAVVGDGEIQEGQIWEAAMAAGHFKLDNLTVIVDNNNLQIDGTIEEVMTVYPIDAKFESFGFHVITVDGHDIPALSEALDTARSIKDKPCAIIAKTIKGKGVSFMENDVQWHGNTPGKEQYETAITELDAVIAELEGR